MHTDDVIKVTFQHRSMSEPVDLPGCETADAVGGRKTRNKHGVQSYPPGELTLVFAEGSPGAGEMARRANDDEGAAFCGMITIVKDGITTEYNCGFMDWGPLRFTFTFTNLDARG